MCKLKIELLKEIVDLDAYAQSCHFVGYSESVPFGKWKDVAVEIFLDFIRHRLDECFLISSATQSTRKEGRFSRREEEVMSKLEQKGWIEFDKEDEDVQTKFNAFPLRKENPDTISQLCELVLDGNIYGHVFFLWEEENLVIYPHNDFGFGVLAPTNTKGEILGLEFLNGFRGSGLFDVDIRRS